MKKIVLTLVAIFTVSMAFASNNERIINDNEVVASTMEQNYDMSLNYGMLANTLQLDNFQLDAVKLVYNDFVQDMKAAGDANPAERKSLVKKAVIKDLQHMKYVLSNEQYRKYLMLLNVTLNNRNLLK